MRTLGVKLLKILAAVAILAALLRVTVEFIILGYLEDPKYVAGLLEKALGPAFIGEIALSRAIYEVPLHFYLAGAELRDPRRADPLFSAPHIFADLSVQGLLDGRLQFESLKVVDWTVRLHRQSDGSWLLPLNTPTQSATVRRPLHGTMLATAGQEEVPWLSIDSLEFPGGTIELTQDGWNDRLKVTNVDGKLSFDGRSVISESVKAKLWETFPVTAAGRVTLLPALAVDGTVDLGHIDLDKLEERLTLMKQLETFGIEVSGGVLPRVTALFGPEKRQLTAALSFKGLRVADHSFTGRALDLPRGAGTLEADLASEGGPRGKLDLALEDVRVAPAAGEGIAFPFTKLTLGADFHGLDVSLRELTGQIGQGTVKVTGAIQGLLPQLRIEASMLPVQEFMKETAMIRTSPWLKTAVIPVLEGAFTLGELRLDRARLESSGSTIELSGSFRPGPSGYYEPYEVAGETRARDSFLATVLGIDDAWRVEGEGELKFVGHPRDFNAELRSSNLSFRLDGPRLDFRGVAARINGVRELADGGALTAWAANVAASEFLVTWPGLMKALGIPVEGAVKMSSGEAQMTHDPEGLNISRFRCTSELISLHGSLVIPRSGEISGSLQVEAFSSPGVPLKTIVGKISGSLAAPVITPQ